MGEQVVIQFRVSPCDSPVKLFLQGVYIFTVMFPVFLFLSYIFASIPYSTTIRVDVRPIVRCKFYKQGTSLDVGDLVGVWMTMYIQPKAVQCFSLDIRATTELEREQHMINYGNFSGNVVWSDCKLEVRASYGKHFLQGDGSSAGLLENIVIKEDKLHKGTYFLQEQSADQWTLFGRRGFEILLMRDCAGESLAVFAREPYWPSATELYSILHRSGVPPMMEQQRVLCEPLQVPPQPCYANHYHFKKKFWKQP